MGDPGQLADPGGILLRWSAYLVMKGRGEPRPGIQPGSPAYQSGRIWTMLAGHVPL